MATPLESSPRAIGWDYLRDSKASPIAKLGLLFSPASEIAPATSIVIVKYHLCFAVTFPTSAFPVLLNTTNSNSRAESPGSLLASLKTLERVRTHNANRIFWYCHTCSLIGSLASRGDFGI
jgi:hypothetical protein